MEKFRGILTPQVRRYIYGICIVLMPLLVFYGILTAAAAPLWIALVGAILVPAMALPNTPKPPEEGQ